MDQAVSHRLDRLERENRFFKAVGLVALAVIAAVVLMGQATPSTKTDKVEIFGKTGIIKLDVSPAGNPRLVLVDHNLINRMGLTMTPGGPVLFLADEKGYFTFLLDSGPKGPSLKLTTQKMFYAPSNTPHMIFHGPYVGEPMPSGLALSATSSGLFLKQFDTVRAQLSLSDNGSPEVKLFKLDKKVIWSAP